MLKDGIIVADDRYCSSGKSFDRGIFTTETHVFEISHLCNGYSDETGNLRMSGMLRRHRRTVLLMAAFMVLSLLATVPASARKTEAATGSKLVAFAFNDGPVTFTRGVMC